MERPPANAREQSVDKHVELKERRGRLTSFLRKVLFYGFGTEMLRKASIRNDQRLVEDLVGFFEPEVFAMIEKRSGREARLKLERAWKTMKMPIDERIDVAVRLADGIQLDRDNPDEIIDFAAKSSVDHPRRKQGANSGGNSH